MFWVMFNNLQLSPDQLRPYDGCLFGFSKTIIAELSSEGTQADGNDFQWVLSVDGSSNQQGSGVGVILEGPSGLLIKQALRFAFKANNNQVEYEVLIVEMLLAKELGARSLLEKSDSLLVTEQVTSEYQAKDPHLACTSGMLRF